MVVLHSRVLQWNCCKAICRRHRSIAFDSSVRWQDASFASHIMLQLYELITIQRLFLLIVQTVDLIMRLIMLVSDVSPLNDNQVSFPLTSRPS